jgi:hypothetical protein
MAAVKNNGVHRLYGRLLVLIPPIDVHFEGYMADRSWLVLLNEIFIQWSGLRAGIAGIHQLCPNVSIPAVRIDNR